MARQAIKPQLRRSTAQERFTDRREPVKGVKELYEEIKQNKGSYDIIHFYGMGGIGKTSLLKRIMDDQIESGHKNVIMYSFKASQDKIDFLSVLARVIGANVKNADFILFYYAYTKYLQACGLSDTQIEARICKNEMPGNVAAGVAKTAISVGTDFMPVLGGTTGTLANYLVDIIQKRITDLKRNGKWEDKNNITQIDKSGMDDLEKEMQKYFAADCYRFMNEINEPFVILLDDYEYMNDRVKHGNSHEDLWLCDTVDGLVNSLPNTLWIVAGRDRVNWSEEVLPSQNCHSLGSLKEKDATEFFEKAKNSAGESMNSELIAGLFDLTQGIPVYMDMCFERFECDRCHYLEEFGKNTEEIAERYFRDRTHEERTAIEFLCGLTSIWSDEMRKYILDRIKSDEPYKTCLDLKLKGIKEQQYVEKIGNQYKIHDVYRKVVRDNMDQDELKKITNAAYAYLAEMISDKELSISERLDAFRQLDQDIKDYLLVEEDIRVAVLRNIGLLSHIGKYFDYLDIASKMVSAYQNIVDNQPSEDNRLKLLDAQYTYSIGLNLAGDYRKANEIAENVYCQRKSLLGEDKPDTVLAERNLATTYSDMGEYYKALQLYLDVLEKYQKNLGENDSNTISAKFDLANVYISMGEYLKALKLQLEVLEKDLENHSETISIKMNLANTYFEMGEYDKALELQLEVFEKRLEEYGDDHPKTISAKNNLAIFYSHMDEQNKALELILNVLEKFRDNFGEDHPETIMAKMNLSSSYLSIGEYDKALNLLIEVLELCREKLGDNHPYTIRTQGMLAHYYMEMHKFDQALELQYEVIEKCYKKYGENHPETIQVKVNLSFMYYLMGQYDKALKIQLEVVKKYCDLLGVDHPETIRAKDNLACTYAKLGEYDKALELHNEVIEKLCEKYGEVHSKTIGAKNNLSATYGYMSRFDKALEIQLDILEKQTKKQGENNPDTVAIKLNLASSYYNLCEYDKALELLLEVLEKTRKKFGDDNSETLSVQSLLANTYSNLGNYDKALELQTEVLEKLKVIKGYDHPDTLEVMADMTDTYYNLGEYDKAMDMTFDVLEIRQMKKGEDNTKTSNCCF